MVNNNKILTVSYGTFSCTLEGFDDSFGTMKAIAEYFRDLASDDRYFGAEPPQPDADMLARIAQREISRQVDAHQDRGNIVLRARDAVALQDAPSETAPAVAEPEAVQPDAVPVTPQAATARAAEPQPAPVTDAPAEAVSPVSFEDRIEDHFDTDTDEAEAGDIPEAEDIAPVAPQPAATSDAEPAADSIAAKLQRIRAVVSRNEQAAHGLDYSEDEHAEAYVATAVSELNDALLADDEAMQDDTTDDDEITRALNALDAAFDADEAEDQADESDAVAEVEAEAEAEVEAEDLTADYMDDDEVAEELAAAATEQVADVSLDDGTLDDDADEDALKDDDFGDDDDDADDSALFDDLEDADEDSADADDLTNILNRFDDEGDDAELAPEQAADHAADKPRVIKVKRADFEAAIASGKLEEVDEDESSLSPEDEAELMAELAEVQAESEAGYGEEFDDEDLAMDYDMDDDADDAPQAKPATAEADEADVSRLMATADSHMEEPETNSRQEAFSRLRAAVASAKADEAVGAQTQGDTDATAYREDLASVVRPRRPEITSDRPARPVTGSKPAPLKLVAEQRVDDLAKGAPRGPVRPRRVSAAMVEERAAPAVAEVDSGFAEFATEMGATELPDLLEAAAAYMSFVEGRDQFSRPQLMTKVRQAELYEFNREDGLRSFGQLLREGKIEKTEGGRFTASDQIGFRPDHRAVG